MQFTLHDRFYDKYRMKEKTWLFKGHKNLNISIFIFIFAPYKRGMFTIEILEKNKKEALW